MIALGSLVQPAIASAEQVEMLAASTGGVANGLKLAWRTPGSDSWNLIGNGYGFVNSDFGPWGSHKTMFNPSLAYDKESSLWVLSWDATRNGDVTGMATSPDLTRWSPQRYLHSRSELPKLDFAQRRDSITVDGATAKGTVFTADRSLVDSLEAFCAKRNALAEKYAETMASNADGYGIDKVTVNVDPFPGWAKPISTDLIGIFFEDINYAADGGLYGELIQNRDFEYLPTDTHKRDNWNALTAWEAVNGATLTVATENPIHPNNATHVIVKATKPGQGIANTGWDGITVKKGEAYNFSMFANARKRVEATVSLTDKEGKTIGRTTFFINPKGWEKYSASFIAEADCSDARLTITLAKKGEASFDMVSLFPEATFKNRKNGLRRDLAQTLADLHPRFVRFPGGCVAHGNGVDNIYDWKGSVGPLESRKPLYNLWNYHQTRGLGYFEYFQFCEDIGAQPLPVLAAGVPCQNSGRHSHHSTDALTTYGQQGGIPMEEMDAYIQDVLDLIEYANGPADSKWGKLRAEAGHPEPFNLKYIGIGNEDMITEVFEPRFKMICEAVRAKHPEIEIVGTAGPFYEGTDYERGWEISREMNLPLVDEHYYVAPGWLIYNQDYYDGYPRGGSRVYLGEWAAHLPGRPSNIETALSEALYLTSVERNGDVVAMTSYAPLLAKKGHTQWTPDLIYFDNGNVYPTVDYYVQMLYGQNSGDSYIPATVSTDSKNEKVNARVGCSIVKDSTTGETIVKLANLLPVEAEVNVNSTDLGVSPTSVKAFLLTGTPDDSKATPKPVTVALPSITLPPYSFLVARFK